MLKVINIRIIFIGQVCLRTYNEFDSGLVALSVLTQNNNTTILRNKHKDIHDKAAFTHVIAAQSDSQMTD